jgi:group II intron reverse transcriptase/maturase
MSQKSDMHVAGESDGRIVPTKGPNSVGKPTGEGPEGRRPTRENIGQTAAARTQSRFPAFRGLDGVREVARQDKKVRFTALLHHVTVPLLRISYYELKKQAAPGVDGVTWQEYGTGLEERLIGLHARVHRGAYRAQPSKRAYIPKEDGRQRPLGIASLEDKIVQQALVTVLNCIYEEDFQGFSYGFRPARSAHHALDALAVGLTRKKVNWVLDADIRGFFDNVDHGWMLRFLQHRIADRRVLRLIRKWLRAGVSEEGTWTETKVGTPQGAVISPLLANIYLHYVLDLWAHRWREKQATGDVILTRYADDFVMGFQHRGEAERFLEALRERLRQFGLELHSEKTRLIEFGRFAASNRKQRGEGKPETFNFLGFTHMCGTTRTTGRFTVRRKTIAKRLRAKLREVKEQLRRRWHEPPAETGAWLRSVVQGYFNYHAIPMNYGSLATFRYQVARLWHRALRRRSQRARLTWARFASLVSRWLPRPRILHPYPSVRFAVTHPR